jgi:hypothetical protein
VGVGHLAGQGRIDNFLLKPKDRRRVCSANPPPIGIK